jgi:ribosomal protein L16/L10AE
VDSRASRCKNHAPIIRCYHVSAHDMKTDHKFGCYCCRDVGLPRLTQRQVEAGRIVGHGLMFQGCGGASPRSGGVRRGKPTSLQQCCMPPRSLIVHWKLCIVNWKSLQRHSRPYTTSCCVVDSRASRCKNHAPIIRCYHVSAHDMKTDHKFGCYCCRDAGLPRLTQRQVEAGRIAGHGLMWANTHCSRMRRGKHPAAVWDGASPRLYNNAAMPSR